MQEMDSGDPDAQTVPRLLEKLSGPGRSASYYRVGLELLTQAVAGCELFFFFSLSLPRAVIFSLLLP